MGTTLPYPVHRTTLYISGLVLLGEHKFYNISTFLTLQPATSGSAEPAAMATEAPAMEAVAMATDSPTEPMLLESPVLEDDAIQVDNNQSTPTTAKMVE